MRRTLITFAVLIFTACESPDILYLPVPQHELVVNCVAFSDHSLYAWIGVSNGTLEFPDTTSMKNVTLKLYENDVFAETLTLNNEYFEGFQQRYDGKTKPRPGSNYRITAERPGFPMAEAGFRQPDSVHVDSFEVKVLGQDPTYTQVVDVQMRVGFTDPPGEDFYSIAGLQIQDSTDFINRDSSLYIVGQQLVPFFIDPAYEENNDNAYSAVFFDDSYFDGKSVVLDFSAMIDGGATDFKTYVVYLRHVSKEYYLYAQAANLQRTTTGDPFAQPVLIENNIKNGYGVFGGFTQARKIARAK
jgi:hypothetical protein